MELTNLNTEIIDNMSVEDLKTTLKQAYSAAMVQKFNEEEQKKTQEEQHARDAEILDSFFSAKFRH